MFCAELQILRKLLEGYTLNLEKDVLTIFQSLYDRGNCLQARSMTYHDVKLVVIPSGRVLGVATYKCLLIEGAILLFEFDVGEPWLDTGGVAKQILFVDDILVGLVSKSELASSSISPMGQN